MKREDILRRVGRFREQSSEEFGIVRIGVFGSVARDEVNDASDVDIVVELDQPDLLTIVGIKQELQAALDLPVDVVRYRETMNDFLKRHIDQEAVYV